jgi:peptidyl-prolyl cis-trans isomerase SurA
MIKHLFTAALFCFFIGSITAQNEDPTLFTVQNSPVKLSEFKYIYSKTNQDKADFSQASLDEYLDLYVKFKLKVQKAKEMRLDTIPALRSELDGYRRQLANSYLVDKEVTDKLIRETHERMLQDVDISHIFVACDKNAKSADTLIAFNKAMAIYNEIKAGADFMAVAKAKSEDKSAKENGGALGFVTAMFPDGFYLFEKGVYSSKPGQVFGPVRTNSGYHVVKVNEFRAARGEMEVSQILFRKNDNTVKMMELQARVDSVYKALQGGAKWDDLCAKYSEDKSTAAKGGYVGFFGINRYQKSFEDAAFGLKKDGDISAPVQTGLGFHIIKRTSAKPVGSFDGMKRPLTEKVKRDSRSELAKQSMISKIKREGKFEEFPAVLESWQAKQRDTVFLTFKWKPEEAKSTAVLMKYGTEKAFSVADFEEFCARASRDRMRGAGTDMKEVISKLYKNWSDEVAMQFEETQLDKKYPDFKSLMREYEEGILLFDATKQLVWDKANTDSIGLEKYFNENLKDKYKWDERAVVSTYSLKTDDPKEVAKIRELAAKKPAAEVLKKFNKKAELVTVIEKNYEKGKNKDLTELWSTGAISAAKSDAATKTSSFTKVERIEPASSKTLNEARGYAVADYQDFLEKQWIEDLRKMYSVQIDDKVFKSMVKKK